MTPIPSSRRNDLLAEARAVIYRLLSRAFTYPLDPKNGKDAGQVTAEITIDRENRSVGRFPADAHAAFEE